MQETGRFRALDEETGILEKQGFYEFVGDDGNQYRVEYLADESGVQATGAHLPVAPAQIPAYDELRRAHPEIFWVENGGVVRNDQQQFF